jgi:hypothetical protein
MTGVPFNIPNSRLADVFLIGPITILFSFFVKEKWLSIFILLTGILTIVYNGLNWANLNLKSAPGIKIIPKGVRNAFMATNGKTQLVRLINLIIMYPLFIYAFFQVKKDLKSDTPTSQKVVVFLFGFFAFTGFIYNLKNYLKMKLKE